MRRRLSPLEIVKHAIWLVVTLGVSAFMATNLAQLGAWGFAGLAIGGAMLAIYLLEFWAPAGRKTPLTRRLGDYAGLVAIVAACVLLLVLLIDGLRHVNLVRIAIVGLFLVTFGRILRDYLRHLRRRGPERDGG